MHRGLWLSRIAIIIGTIVVLVAAIVVIAKSGRPSPSDPKINGVASDKQVSIPVGSGVSLSAEVVTPKGSGKFPLVVMPTAWGSELNQYHGFVGVLARDGYQVVTYVQRGFHSSGGTADFGDTPTQRDVSRVIDWALAHTPSDPQHIGMFGASYGAGVSLLGAARDPRIKAVVATSSWADFGEVFAGNGTVSFQALSVLLRTAQRVGRTSADLKKLTQTLLTNPQDAVPELRALSKTRSAADEITKLNANKPAIMLASGYEDSILPPLSLVSFYDKLTGPKRLQLSPGDHGGPEASGLDGEDNPTTTAAHQWLDHYLKGKANGIDTQPPVQFTDVVTHEVHRYASWPTSSDRLALGKPDAKNNATPVGRTVWTQQIGAGVETNAKAGGSALNAPQYQPPQMQLSKLDTDHGVFWTGDPVPDSTVLDGVGRVSFLVSSSTGTASLFAYLYDVDADGVSSLMSVTPYTVTGATVAKKVAFDLGPIGWTLAKGHRIGLVVDTADERWTSVSVPGSTVRISSAAAAPATLSLPVAK
jgi:putative CocE/NonD family hydrolase